MKEKLNLKQEEDYGYEWKKRRSGRIKVKSNQGWEDTDVDPQINHHSNKYLLDGWAVKGAHKGVIPKFKF